MSDALSLLQVHQDPAFQTNLSAGEYATGMDLPDAGPMIVPIVDVELVDAWEGGNAAGTKQLRLSVDLGLERPQWVNRVWPFEHNRQFLTEGKFNAYMGQARNLLSAVGHGDDVAKNAHNLLPAHVLAALLTQEAVQRHPAYAGQIQGQAPSGLRIYYTPPCEYDAAQNRFKLSSMGFHVLTQEQYRKATEEGWVPDRAREEIAKREAQLSMAQPSVSQSAGVAGGGLAGGGLAGGGLAGGGVAGGGVAGGGVAGGGVAGGGAARGGLAGGGTAAPQPGGFGGAGAKGTLPTI